MLCVLAGCGGPAANDSERAASSLAAPVLGLPLGIDAARRIPMGIVTPAVTRIALGGFDAPAPGTTLVTGSAAIEAVPSDVPIGAEYKRADTRTLSAVRTSTASFSAIGVSWAPAEGLGGTNVAVRGHRPGGDWADWQTVGVAEEDNDSDAAAGQSRGGADLVWVGPSDGVEVAVSTAGGPAPTDVIVDLIDPLDPPGDAAPQSIAAAAVGVPGAGRVPMPPILRRQAWGVAERQPHWMPDFAPRVKAVVWHHTATSNDYAAADVPKILRSIYQYQTVSRGWSDIGYNVLVDRFGRLWEGRSGGLASAPVGAQAGGFNTGTAGMAVIGNHTSLAVPAATVEAAAAYIAWKFSLGPAVDPRGTVSLTGGGATARWPAGTTITPPRVFPHRETSPTECPGSGGVAALTTLRDRAYALLGTWSDPKTVRTRLATWRPSDGRFRIQGSESPVFQGSPGDVPVPADYDGDGVSDLAAWNPVNGIWRIADSTTGTIREIQWGLPGDRPAPADFDGDGRAEITIWRPSTGTWWVRGIDVIQWGLPGDVPVPADYNGDGRADLTVWRPGNGTWYFWRMPTFVLGESNHIPVPADYDGDGSVDPASWSPTSYRFFVKGRQPVTFGEAGDVPVPGQYDGDGKADLAVFHIHSSGQTARLTTWRVIDIGSYDLGAPGDRPMPLR